MLLESIGAFLNSVFQDSGTDQASQKYLKQLEASYTEAMKSFQQEVQEVKKRQAEQVAAEVSERVTLSFLQSSRPSESAARWDNSDLKKSRRSNRKKLRLGRSALTNTKRIWTMPTRSFSSGSWSLACMVQGISRHGCKL